MEKAYDLKVLKEKLVETGLPEIEDLAEKTYKAVKEWVIESAPVSETKLDDFAPVIFPMIDKIVDPAIDKIDGIKNA